MLSNYSVCFNNVCFYILEIFKLINMFLFIITKKISCNTSHGIHDSDIGTWKVSPLMGIQPQSGSSRNIFVNFPSTFGQQLKVRNKKFYSTFCSFFTNTFCSPIVLSHPKDDLRCRVQAECPFKPSVKLDGHLSCSLAVGPTLTCQLA